MDGGEEGIDCIREIMIHAGRFLFPGGHLLMEMGFDQKEKVTVLAKTCPELDLIEVVKDLAGHDRVVHLKKKLINPYIFDKQDRICFIEAFNKHIHGPGIRCFLQSR